MPRPSLALAALTLVTLSLGACTNWDAGINGNIAVSNDPRAVADVDHTGLVWWETQGTAGADASVADDAATAEDATSGSDDALAVEILGSDADETLADASEPDTLVDGGQDGLVAADGLLDVASQADSVADLNGSCSGPDRPIGCDCSNSQQCASGLCVFGPIGLVCSPTCKDILCPAGWACVTPAMVCKQVPDATQVDVMGQDAGVPDAAANDTGQPTDTAAVDSQMPDAGMQDEVLSDAPNPDGQLADTTASDAATSDATGDDGSDAATDQPDAAVADGQPTDGVIADAVADAGFDASQDIDTDGLTGLDWQGYPDAAFPDDADIYGGAINSCLSLYLYQQETCGKANPTAACIDSVASQGSLYANFLFEPVRACQDALCVDLCATATDETCMNQCIGKNCPNQFLSCVSNDQQGTADCKTTFSCSMGYPGKLLTIGAKCYANGTLDAQLQVGGLISCETKPNTDSCFQAIGDCYDQGATATNTCMQTITCTQNCTGSQDCVWQCLGKATPTARKAIDALGDCMVTVCGPKCNGDQNCQNTCISTDCATPFGNCVAN